jgi:hypothetical protein
VIEVFILDSEQRIYSLDLIDNLLCRTSVNRDKKIYLISISMEIIIFNKRTVALVLMTRRINEIYILAWYLYEISHKTVMNCVKINGGK